VRVIPVIQDKNKWVNTWRSWLTVASTPDLPDDIVVMNDDFFFTREVTHFPIRHRGPYLEVARTLRPVNEAMWRRRHITLTFYRHLGYCDPLEYELHMPMTVSRQAISDIAVAVEDLAARLAWPRGKMYWPPLGKRSLYGNLCELGGQRSLDCKVTEAHQQPIDPDLPYLSTTDWSFRFGRVGQRIRAMFPDPCKYEGDGGAGDHINAYPKG
jgi:hypothetical protein